MAPSFRPDKVLNINKPGFAAYMGKLAAAVGKDKLACINCVTSALTDRIEFFAEMGCRASDHGLDYIPYREATTEEVNAIYQKVMAGETCTPEELRSIRPTSSSIWASSITASASSCSSTTTACGASTAS